jgi:F-type H+-transporting ATPase subunit a
MKHILFIIGFCTVLCWGNVAMASSEPEKGAEKEPFSVIDLIMHHIKDSHEWHILDYKKSDGTEVPVAVPLPIIVFHDGQLDVFMSSEFEHGHKIVERGNNKYILHHEKIYLADESGQLKMEEKDGEHVVLNDSPLDFSITKNVLSMMIVSLIIFFVFYSVARAYKKRPGAPRGFQSLMEMLILFVKDEIVYPNLGKKTDKFLPYLLTVFFFILFNNLMGIIPLFPGGANVTGNIAVTMTLAMFTFLAINLNGNKHYWKHTLWMPGVPVFVKPILAIVELMGMIVKPVALTIRLFANITAGHIIIISLVSLIFIFESFTMSPVSFIFVIFMNCLELLVAFLQAYIFTMLSSLFIGMAVEEHH